MDLTKIEEIEKALKELKKTRKIQDYKIFDDDTYACIPMKQLVNADEDPIKTEWLYHLQWIRIK